MTATTDQKTAQHEAAVEMLQGRTLWVQTFRRTASRHHCLVFMTHIEDGEVIVPVTWEVARLMGVKTHPVQGTIAIPVNGYEAHKQIADALAAYGVRAYALP